MEKVDGFEHFKGGVFDKVIDEVCAWTSDEILERLPHEIEGYDWSEYSNKYHLNIIKGENDYWVAYESPKDTEEWFEDPKLSNALAEMWIWLIENGHINVK